MSQRDKTWVATALIDQFKSRRDETKDPKGPNFALMSGACPTNS